MAKKSVTLSFLFLFCVQMIAPSIAYAQDDGGGVAENVIDQSLQDFTIVVGVGLGGALLGLSTLSFVEEPSDHLDNIIVGGALGVILGVAIVAYGQANKSQERYLQGNNLRFVPDAKFATSERTAWHSAEYSQLKAKPRDPALNLNFTF